MAISSRDFIEKLHKARRWRPELQALAAELEGVPASEIIALLQRFIQEGEDKALIRLLNVCAIREFKVDAALLAGALRVVENPFDIGCNYKTHDQSAIPSLLELATSEDLSAGRRALAARLAAELSHRFNQDKEPVRKVLYRQISEFQPSELSTVVRETAKLLDQDLEEIDDELWLTSIELLEELPEEKPPTIIGGHFSVRRPVEKIGRNDPCHCGSGKKYKKCCYAKDQELWQDASQFSGMTMTQVRQSPGLTGNIEVIDSMRAFEVKRLRPDELNDRQLIAAYRRADGFGLHELAHQFLCELRNRDHDEDFVEGHLADLLDSVLNVGKLDLARKIMQQLPEDSIYITPATRFHFSVVEDPERLAGLEQECRRAILGAGDDMVFDHPLIALSHEFEKLFPALSIVFGRAAIAGNPDRWLDNEALLSVIGGARAALELEPWGDPIEEFYEWTLENESLDLNEDEREQEIDVLKERARQAQQLAAEKVRELQQKEKEISALAEKLERLSQLQLQSSAMVPEQGQGQRAVANRQLEELRRRVKNLKAEIKLQQEARANLRGQLREKKTKEQERQTESSTQADPEAPGIDTALVKSPKRILIPEYTDAFRRSSESLPPPIVAKALQAVAGFASHDPAVLRHAKHLGVIQDCYRVRIGIHFRLLLLWQQDTLLKVLDLIPREKQDTWIKQHLNQKIK